MKKNFLLFYFLFLMGHPLLFAQKPTVEILSSGNKISLRGLSVVNDNVVWVSGSKGTVGKSSNGGKNWKWMVVKGYEKTEFRDIEAFDAGTAVIMAVDTPAVILKTTDGGETWKLTYQNTTKGMFLDAMDFAGDQYGIVIGDPINRKIFMAETFNGGDSWTEIPAGSKIPLADSGEAFFAASGTNIRLMIDKRFYAVSGGLRSRLLSRTAAIPLPLIQGKETTGANSIDVYDNGNGKGSKRMIITGGDFANENAAENNCFISDNGGKTWKAPKVGPHGYRSCVEFLSRTDVLACGLTGVDYSFNAGKTWELISKESFHVCRIAKSGRTIYLAGNNGQIGKIVWK